MYSDNWLTHTVFCKLSLTRTRNPPDHLLDFLLRTLRAKCQLQNPGMFAWYSWPFIVSVITIMSFALIKLWISSFPSLSPIPLIFHVSIRISFNLIHVVSRDVIFLPAGTARPQVSRSATYLWAIVHCFTCLLIALDIDIVSLGQATNDFALNGSAPSHHLDQWWQGCPIYKSYTSSVLNELSQDAHEIITTNLKSLLLIWNRYYQSEIITTNPTADLCYGQGFRR